MESLIQPSPYQYVPSRTDGTANNNYLQVIEPWTQPVTWITTICRGGCHNQSRDTVGGLIDAFLALSDEDKALARTLLDGISKPKEKRAARK